MPLISCPECGKEISDNLLSCPNCGYDLTKRTANKTYSLNKKKIIIGILLCVFAFILFVLS